MAVVESSLRVVVGTVVDSVVVVMVVVGEAVVMATEPASVVISDAISTNRQKMKRNFKENTTQTILLACFPSV